MSKVLHYRDSKFKICHRPGLGAQKVENHCFTQSFFQTRWRLKILKCLCRWSFSSEVSKKLFCVTFLSYRVCQGLWPSLMFADEDIEPQNFWASSKRHVATTFLCMHFCSNYNGWSNQGKYYEIETHYAKQDVAT